MSEQDQPTEQTTENNSPVEQTETPVADKPIDWRDSLNTVEPDELLRHPRVAGILGSRIDQAIRRREAEIKAQATADAERRQQDDLDRLIEENPEVVEQKYPGVVQWAKQRRTALEEAEQARRVREIEAAYERQLGQSYQTIPEWAELNDADKDRIQKSLVGLQRHEVLPAFNAVAADIIAEKRAEKKVQARMAAQLEKERQAIRNEEAAKLLASSDAPDLHKASRRPSNRLDPRKLSDKDFDAYYEREIKNRRK